MDLNYEIGTWQSPLGMLCMVKICQHLLEVAIRQSDRKNCWFTVITAATERLDNFNLPTSVKNKIKTLLRPISDEIYRWDPYMSLKVRPVLTSHGTVDPVKSTKKAAKSRKDHNIVTRYILACDNCHEGRILKLGRRIVSQSVIPGSNSLAHFWYEIYNCNFRRKIKREDLTLQQCKVGFQNAVSGGHHVAIKYFGERLPQEVFLPVIASCLREYHSFQIPPVTLVFLYLRMNESLRMTWLPLFSNGLLNALVHWPYQHLFMEAAEQLMEHLSNQQFKRILLKILEKADVRVGYSDADYADLFVGFWQLGGSHRHAFFIDAMSQLTVYHVFLPGDKRIADLVMEDFSVEDKEKMLLEFDKHSIGMRLAKEERYGALELFIRVCGMGRKNLLAAFRRYLEKNAQLTSIMVHCLYYTYESFDRQWMACIDKVVEITDKIISETT